MTARYADLKQRLGRAWGIWLVAVLSYILFSVTWFDHGIDSRLVRIPAVVPAALLVISAGLLAWARGFPRLFPDSKDNRLAWFTFALAVVSRLPFLACSYGLFSSDSAVHGIMSLHILGGRHHPVFAYGESYDGSLKAHFSALITLVTNEPVLSFAAVSIPMYAAFVVSLFALARATVERNEATVAAIYVIVAPGYLTAWGLRNDGSYVEVLAFGTALLVLGTRFLAEQEGRLRRAFWMGFLGSLAFWSPSWRFRTRTPSAFPPLTNRLRKHPQELPATSAPQRRTAWLGHFAPDLWLLCR